MIFKMNKTTFSNLFFLFLLTITFAQTKEEIELREMFWDTKETNKNIIEIPEKWKSESAVILYKEEYFKFTNNGKKMYSPSFLHQRVKLLDKAAVEGFSEFEYNKDQKIGYGFYNYFKENTTLGIKIIKANGEEVILDIDAETIKQDEGNKIAIPGLEVGDIIDMYVYEDDYLRSFTGSHIYDPVEKTLSSRYPILYSKLSVEVENDYFLNMESYNGAPKIKEVATDKRRTRRYEMVGTNIDKSDFPRWFYPLLELPAIKFQVTFALKAKNEVSAKVFLSEDDAARKSNVTKDEIIEYYGNRFGADTRKEVKQVLNYLKQNGITNKREQMVKGLYYIRHMSYNRFIELLVASENNISNFAMPCDEDYIILNDDTFVNYMAGLAKQLEINYDIIVATPIYNGSIENLLLRSNVSYGLRFNFSEPLYFFDLTAHVQAEYFSKYLEGTKIYVMNVKKDRKIESVSLDILPTTTAEENTTTESVKVEISDDFKTFSVERNLKFTGHFKTYEIDNRVFFGDYLDEEFEYYNTKHFYNCGKKQKKSFKEIEDKINAVMETYRENREKNMEERVASGFDVKIDDYSSQVINTSRYNNKPLEIEDKFTISDEFVKKAGPNYIVEVGRFISGQIKLEDDELERDSDVYMNYAKMFSYNIEIKIPEGYEVVGLDKLNKSIENNTGGFTSKALIENGILKYSTTKVYQKGKYSSSEWTEMIPWLKEAYDFSQEKVMFKKM